MARPRSDEKRSAILAAATKVVAEQGISATTAKVAKGAGVAEGTLFTYFDSKDALLNELYLELKGDLRDAMMAGYLPGKDLHVRARHVWDRYIDWGTEHPLKRKAMGQLAVSDRITDASKNSGQEAFRELDDLMRESLVKGSFNPPEFAAAILTALADTTIDFITREPGKAKRFKAAGFAALWKAIGGG